MQLAFYLRFLLLVCRSISGHLAHTSPTTTPHPEERAKYTARSTSDFWERGFYIGHAASFTKVEYLTACLGVSTNVKLIYLGFHSPHEYYRAFYPPVIR